MKSKSLLRISAALALACVGSALADSLTWDNGASTGNWNFTDANWTGDTWDNSVPDSAVFNTTTGNINLTEAITAGSLTFGVANANTTGSFSGSPLTINGDLIATADGNNGPGGPLVTFSNNVTVGGSVLIARRVLGVATGGSLTAGTIGSNNAWGRLEIGGGTVTATNGVDDTGGIMSVFLNGGSLHAPYIKTTSISWTALGNDGVVLNGGTLHATANAADFIQTYEINGWGNRNNLGAGTNGANINTSGFDISITKSIQDYGGAGTLTKTGAGTLTLTGANTYTGNTTINAGTLKIAEGASIYNGGYNGSAVLTVNNGATLELNRWGYGPGAANQSLGGLDYNPARFVINGGTVKYTGGAAGAPTDPNESPYGPGFTIGALGATLDAATAGDTWTVKYDSRGFGPIASNEGGTLTLTGIGNGVFDKELGGTGGVVMNGSGTWTLNRTNTYSGSTTVSSGTLSLATPSLDNASSVVIGTTPGATMNLNFTGHDIVGSLAINGSGALPAGTYNSSHPTYGSYFTGSGALVVAPAGNGTWTSLVDGNWEDPANWLANTVAIGADSTATFNAASGATVTLSGALTIGNLVFDVSDYTIAGAALTLDASGTPAISVATDRTATIAANLAGIAGMEKTGNGTLVFTGLKSYTGGTTVTGGTLELQGGNSGNAQIHGSLVVNTGATVLFTGGDSTGFGYFNNPVTSTTVDGGTIDAVSGSHLGFGPAATLTLDNGGTLQGSWQWNGDALLTFASFGDSTNTIDATLNLRNDVGPNHSFSVADGASATDLLISGTLTGAGANVVKNDAGTLVLSGVNTYTGNTTVNDGSLQLTSTSQMQFVVTDAPASNQITGTGSVTCDGVFNIDTSAVAGTTGYIWLLVDRASLTGESFDANFSVAGFNPELDGVTWTMSDARGTWTFSETTGELTLDIGNDFDTWKTDNGVTGGENDDDDKDGVTNREEYAFGLNPTSGASLNPIIVPLDTSTGTLTYTRRLPSLTGLNYSVWYSTDLAVWTEDTGATEGTLVVNGQVETVPVTLTNSLLANPSLFVQIRAE